MAIAPPGSNYKREVAAIIVTSMAASANPIAGFCLEMLKLCWPPNSAIDEARWPAEITDTVNCIEERIDAIAPRLVPSEDALCLGRWMSRNAECGFADIFDDNAFLTAFPANSPREILDALGELSAFGLLNISLVIGRPFGHVQLSSEFYAVFDPIAFPGINPRVDAIDVAIALLQSIQSSISAQDFGAARGWPTRRLNPAFRIVGEFIAQGRKSEYFGTPYAISHMFADPTERARLKQFTQSANAS